MVSFTDNYQNEIDQLESEWHHRYGEDSSFPSVHLVFAICCLLRNDPFDSYIPWIWDHRYDDPIEVKPLVH